MSNRADILIAAQQTMNVHHRTDTGTCAECKTSHPHPCPTWTLATQVVSLVCANIRRHPPAGPDPVGAMSGTAGAEHTASLLNAPPTDERFGLNPARRPASG
jgi:hypothetical protein